MLAIGSIAPPFELPDQTGAIVRLAEVLRRGPVVLYFYPADFTPVCTRQACMFRDVRRELVDAGVQVIGVSPQGTASHERFAAKHSLGFPLLADPEKRVLRAYGAVGLLGLATWRLCYLVDEAGVVQDAMRADWRVSRHRAFVERVLAGVKQKRAATGVAARP